jgi:outer membrane receptor for ferrienterochelin and colicins
MRMKLVALIGVSLSALSVPALAQVSPTADASAAESGVNSGQGPTKAVPDRTAADAPSDIVVTAKRLDEARASIQPSLGATSYTITNETIQALPGGDNQQFNQIILQLPGVVQDGFGQFHVRDDHNNLQYRINGVILPEGVSVFGQTLSPRLIERFSLLTGALPAQYGLRTAGIIDVTTKSGLFKNGGSVSIYGGSHDMIEPSIEYGGSTGSTNFFVSGDYRQNNLGLENVDSSRTAIHDKTRQYQGFVYLDHILSDSDRISFVGGYSNQYFQIPNPRGIQADGTYSVGGRTDFLSDNLNENQLEKTSFGQLALLHSAGALTYQASLFARYSTLDFRPDRLGELLFTGQSPQASKKDFTFGAQFDASYKIGSANTLRGGILITRDRGVSNTNTQVFPVDDAGNQSGEPFSVPDNGAKSDVTESVYLQDELRLTSAITLNIGGRFDHYCGFRCEQQFSPRANIVYQENGTTLHLGYARYFTPAPFELVGTETVTRFVGTSAAPNSLVNTTPFAERTHYLDLGIQQKISPSLTVGIDGYFRRSFRLIDEGQFGAPIVLFPYNYNRGKVQGVEVNGSYAAHGLLAYANFAYAREQGRQLVSSEFNFNPDDLAYIQNNYIFTDHNQTFTASGGLSYRFESGSLNGLKLGADALYGSGLRKGLILADGTNIPNGAAVPNYATVNLTASYRLARQGIELRFDVINVGDHIYTIRDGSGVGVGAPQIGARRGFFVGLSKSL